MLRWLYMPSWNTRAKIARNHKFISEEYMSLDPKLKIYPLPILSDNYVWLIINEAEKTAISVDPGDAKPVQAFLEKQHIKLTAILITHYHWDHYNGVAELKRHYNV